MNTVETSVQDSDLLWTNFEQLETGYSNSLKINLLAASAPLAEALTAGMYGPSAFGWSILKTSFISTIAYLTLLISNVSLFQTHLFFKNRVVKVIGTEAAILITIVAIYYLKSFAILPIFQGMCHYSAYLQLEGLTEEKGNQLRMQDAIKHIVSTNTAINIPIFNVGYIRKIGNLKDYLQFTFMYNSSIHKNVSNLLDLAYTHRKILTFNLAIILNKIMTGFLIYGQNAKSKQFEISVDYLIRCKKLYGDLDEAFVNTQLKYLIDFYSSHLLIANGIPVINQTGDELGDISQLKQKLIECFGSVIENN